MSGYGPGDLGRLGYLDEDAPLIQKPFNRDTLLSALDRALGR
jgi:hypothetical protein